MTLHLKRINGFGNGNGGGGGGEVETIESKSNFLINAKDSFNNKRVNSDYGFATGIMDRLFIEQNKALWCYAPYSSYEPKKLIITNISLTESTTTYNLHETTEASVNLDFGQTYSSYPTIMDRRANFSPDKSKIVVIRQASPYNTIYVVPLSKNNDVYSFGTVVTTNLTELSSATNIGWVRFLDNNTFVTSFYANSSWAICVCQIENDNTVSVIKTISIADLNIGTTDIILLEVVNGLVLIVDTNTKIISFIDVDNETAVYTETSEKIIASSYYGSRKILVYDENKVFIGLSYFNENQPFLVYSVTNKVVTKHSFTVSSGTSIPSLQYFDFWSIFYTDTNKVGILYSRPTYPHTTGGVFYDFQNFVLSGIEVVNSETSNSSGSTIRGYVYNLNSLFFVLAGYQGSSRTYTFYYIQNSVSYKIGYGDYIYLLSDKITS